MFHFLKVFHLLWHAILKLTNPIVLPQDPSFILVHITVMEGNHEPMTEQTQPSFGSMACLGLQSDQLPWCWELSAYQLLPPKEKDAVIGYVGVNEPLCMRRIQRWFCRGRLNQARSPINNMHMICVDAGVHPEQHTYLDQSWISVQIHEHNSNPRNYCSSWANQYWSSRLLAGCITKDGWAFSNLIDVCPHARG